ncbi:uncharacterized protein CLUP02_04151 [Colletotrichum lupini]|uniref:Uncharacterized protein n=1 Tax=Colletotrichum lupini TaxID=145971 RepID=A0A9Q8SJW4_9PEZI|nr:uncharacterized protein CLUP02_04151 [Colletotrichum lupini]UQC78674.1 hypothetical protein CLUP02_04151 [Colletotrichum lupini]
MFPWVQFMKREKGFLGEEEAADIIAPSYLVSQIDRDKHEDGNKRLTLGLLVAAFLRPSGTKAHGLDHH